MSVGVLVLEVLEKMAEFFLKKGKTTERSNYWKDCSGELQI